MTADLAIQVIYATMVAIGCPLAMVAGWRERPKKKAVALKRPGRRPSARVKAQKKLTNTDKKKRPAKIKAPEMSAWERTLLDNYFIKRDYPGQVQP